MIFGGDACCSLCNFWQSLSQISNIVVVPSKNQVTVHPQTGKRERIFVNLSVIYPNPEEAGTELSFEEILAANRGWLDHSWEEEETVEDESGPTPEPPRAPENPGARSQKLMIHQDPPAPAPPARSSGKLVIHQDPPSLLDENGVALPQAKEPRVPKKKKVMEVNETQISESAPKMFHGRKY